MDNVIDFNASRVKKGDIYSWIVCPQCMDETNFAIVAVALGGRGFVISKLVCLGPNCEGEGTNIDILNGIINDDTG